MKKFIDDYLKKYSSTKLKIYDIGSWDGNGCYKLFFNNPNWKYLGVDIQEGKNVDIVLRDVYSWEEIKSGSADVVISGQALEHVEYPWKTMSEIARILKYDGLGCIIVPSSGPEHKAPLDCWRFFPDGLKALADYSGLDVIDTYNCWNDPPIDGEENIWKDSVMVFTKKKKNLTKMIRLKIRSCCLRNL